MNDLKIKIKTLTPLWTGGIDTTMDRIHETGIIGSLRWWYEAIVRGLGGNACDPTESKKCQYDPNDKRSPEEQLCPACYIFGTTGWQRRFRLEIVEDNTEPLWEPKDKMLNIRPPGRTRGWYLPPGRMGSFALKFTGDPKMLSSMAALLLFLEKWGDLGAKPQLGYGAFKIENRNEILEWAKGNGKDKPGWKWEILGDKNPDEKLPDLRRFGFFKFRFTPKQPGWWTQVPGLKRVSIQVQPIVTRYNIVPVTPALKNEWRFNQWNHKWGDNRKIFGSLKPDRRRSKVNVSWTYKLNQKEWEIRGWVWLVSEKWEKPLWNLIIQKSTWEKVLNLNGNPSFYRLLNINDVIQFLEEVCNGKNKSKWGF